MRKTDMAHYTLVARTNSGGGKFPFVNVQFSKNHRPIPIERPLIDKANDASYTVKRPKKPCHAFRVLYATRRHHHGVKIETLRQELGHSDITTTQIYLRSANTKSDRHRARINEADRFSLAATCKPFLLRAVTNPARKEEIACIQ
jgi:integrase